MTKPKSSAWTPLHLKKLLPLASLLIVISASGCQNTRSCLSAFCAPYEASKGSCTTERQARRCARAIWDTHHAQCYLSNCHYKEVREGFIAGFVSVCSGGNTCPPMFAPAKHGLCGLNKRCSTAWHEGWPLGAVAAESSGFCNSCCSRAHPCLRAPRIPCNGGCVSCGNTDGGYSDDYVIEPMHVPEASVEIIHEEIEAPAVPTEHQYEAPIEAPAEPIEEAPAVEESAALPAPAPAPEPESAPAPAPPSKESVQLAEPLNLEIANSFEPTVTTTQPVTSKRISGIQDAGNRIASLIEKLETDAAQ